MQVQDLDTQLLAPPQGSTTQNGKTRYDVSLADGNTYSFFKPPLLAKVNALVGQEVTARVSYKPKNDGQGFWFNLEDIAPRGMLQPMAMPVAPGTPVQPAAPVGQQVPPQQASQQFTPPPQQQQSRGYGWQTHPEDAGRMGRSAAAASAARLLSGTGAGHDEFRKLTEEIALYTETGLWEAPAGTLENDGTAAGVAEAVNAEAGAPVVAAGVPWQQPPQ